MSCIVRRGPLFDLALSYTPVSAATLAEQVASALESLLREGLEATCSSSSRGCRDTPGRTHLRTDCRTGRTASASVARRPRPRSRTARSRRRRAQGDPVDERGRKLGHHRRRSAVIDTVWHASRQIPVVRAAHAACARVSKASATQRAAVRDGQVLAGSSAFIPRRTFIAGRVRRPEIRRRNSRRPRSNCVLWRRLARGRRMARCAPALPWRPRAVTPGLGAVDVGSGSPKPDA